MQPASLASKAKSIGSSGVHRVYRTGSPVAHKGMKLNPTGYINREVNKGSRIQPSTQRSGLATMSLRRAAMRRMEARKRAPRAVGRSGGS